jgi:cytoskeleton protein RodZ
MHSIGDRLRQERLRRGLDLGQVSDLTKINPTMLEAIEADDFDKLPGSFFARSFVRQYAKALGLDENEFEEDLVREVGYEEPQLPDPEAAVQARSIAPLAVPPVRRLPRRHSLAALVAFIAIVAVCSAVYTLVQRSHRVPVVAPPPAAAPAPRAPAETSTPAATPSPTPEATPARSATPPPTLPPGEAVAPAPAPAATATPRPAARSSVLEGESAAIRLELNASAEAWVRVTSDGKSLFTGVLQPGEARVFEGQSRVTLRTGNAAALAVTFNGQPVGEIGAPNQVRTMQFTPTGFSFIAPAAPTPSPSEP